MTGANRAAAEGVYAEGVRRPVKVIALAITLAFRSARSLVFSLGFALTPQLAVAQDPPTKPVVQARPTRAKPRDVARGGVLTSALDSWLVTRFRNAQLLDDGLDASTSVEENVQYPRVESAREAPGGDTLFAIHFGSGPRMPALRSAAVVRMSGPSGSITSHAARIVVRRAFRAPRVPSANASDEGAWRYGWAYLAVITRGVRPSPSLGYRGWLLIETPDTLGRSSGAAPSHVIP